MNAYATPLIEAMINKIAKYRLFGTFDLRSNNHQIAIDPKDKSHTAFVACGRPISSDGFCLLSLTGFSVFSGPPII